MDLTPLLVLSAVMLVATARRDVVFPEEHHRTRNFTRTPGDGSQVRTRFMIHTPTRMCPPDSRRFKGMCLKAFS